VFLRLFLLLTLVPLVELAILFMIAQHTRWEFTLGLVIVTALLGSWLARREGLRCWRQFHEQLAAGQLPADALLDGLMILIAGALLITPGVLTDLVGFGLLVPPIRRWIKRYVAKRIQARIVVRQMPGTWDADRENDDVIDV
jgi:UPF0716 protein FxsA